MRMRPNEDVEAVQPAGGAIVWVAVLGYFAVCGILLTTI